MIGDSSSNIALALPDPLHQNHHHDRTPSSTPTRVIESSSNSNTDNNNNPHHQNLNESTSGNLLNIGSGDQSSLILLQSSGTSGYTSMLPSFNHYPGKFLARYKTFLVYLLVNLCYFLRLLLLCNAFYLTIYVI